MTAEDIQWLNAAFGPAMDKVCATSYISKPFLCAIACQETGFIWATLRHSLAPADVLAMCVGDTLDQSNGRRAFPKTKQELLASPRGDEMFHVARSCLKNLADHFPAYQHSLLNPDKFCHAFGMFQRDIQAFPVIPEYFLERRWADFEACLGSCVEELNSAAVRLGRALTGANVTLTSDEELCAVAIAYNAGHYDPSRGLMQGYFDGTKYYGEQIMSYLRVAKQALDSK